jgi:hypothetical protein
VEQAARLLSEHGADEAQVLIETLVEVTRKAWPDCSLVEWGRIALPGRCRDARRQAERKRIDGRRQSLQRRRQEQAERGQQDETTQDLKSRWEALSLEQRLEIEQRVRERAGNAPAIFIQRLCLDEIRRMPT